MFQNLWMFSFDTVLSIVIRQKRSHSSTSKRGASKCMLTTHHSKSHSMWFFNWILSQFTKWNRCQSFKNFIVVDNLTNTYTLIYWNKCAYCRRRNTLSKICETVHVCGCQFKRHFDPTNFRLRFWITLWAIIKFNERRILS